jgi:hypothetical protein
MKFFIKRFSTLPHLEIDLEDVSKKYNIKPDHWDSCAVTFSMYDKTNNVYKIANKEADLLVKERTFNLGDPYNYYLKYSFTQKDTSKFGEYIGEFKVDFLGKHPIGKLTIPVDGTIDIIVKDSITRTDLSTNISLLPNRGWYYGLFSRPGGIVEIPTASEINFYSGIVVTNQNPKANIRIDFNSQPSDFLWFMIPSEYPVKTNWDVTLLNTGIIGGPKTANGNLFPNPELFTFNSTEYNLYISNYRTKVDQILIRTV